MGERVINIFQPSLRTDELEAVSRVFASNWIGKGKETSSFEAEFACALGCYPDNFVSTSCCTEGLFLAPELFNCEGYDVIVPTISFVAAGNAVLAAGADVILCDVDPRTLNVRAEDIEKVLTPSTKAVIVTHYGGFPCDMNPIMDLCNSRNVKVIEDAACAPMAMYKGKACGTIGDMGVWSFDAMKIMTTGDGGMVYLKDPEMIEKAKEHLYLGLPGKTKSGLDSSGKDNWWEYDVIRPGRRAIMNDITAAIGKVQLTKLPGFIARRKEISKRYRDEFGGLGWLNLCPDVPGSYYMFWIQSEYRNKLARYLLTNNIYSTFRYWPLHRTKLFKCNGNFPNADFASSVTLNIPVHQGMSNDDVSHVIDTIKQFGKVYA